MLESGAGRGQVKQSAAFSRNRGEKASVIILVYYYRVRGKKKERVKKD